MQTFLLDTFLFHFSLRYLEILVFIPKITQNFRMKIKISKYIEN